MREYRNILVYAMVNLGDVILTTSAIALLKKALTEAGLKQPGYACHLFRHSCGTNLYQETKDLRVVQETLRQRSPKVTAKYAHVHDRMERRYTRGITPGVNVESVQGTPPATKEE